MRTYRPARKGLAAAVLFAVLALALLAACVLRGGAMLHASLDGRQPGLHAHSHLPEFELRAQMNSAQADARVSGWLSVIAQRETALTDGDVKLAAWVYEPLSGGQDAPWALLLHGGQGSDHRQLIDAACRLSLEGYRVLAPDLRAHGASGGKLTSMGFAESRDVTAWAEWIVMQEKDAQIVILGYDEGAAAALLAQGLPDAVRAIAVDSAYAGVRERALEAAKAKGVVSSSLDAWIFSAAYAAAFSAGKDGDVLKRAALGGAPLLIIHGTGDGDVPAWHAEDIAAAAGSRARLLYIEGAAHGMARFLEPDAYYDALLAFFGAAIQKTPLTSVRDGADRENLPAFILL